MPIYEYECQSCGRSFEYMQSISEPPKTTCEACGGALKKQISAAGFILKGGGWYKDLYASRKPGASEKAGGGSEKPAEKAADKPAEKKDSSTAASSPGGTTEKKK